MSRQRIYGNGFTQRLRSDKPVYQASDSEIKADLRMLESAPVPVKKIPEVVISETVLPRKRAASVEDFEYVIDGLVKLMTARPKEVKKKLPVVPTKETEVPIKPVNPFIAMMPYFSMQAPCFFNDPCFYGSFFNFPSYTYNMPMKFTSTADYHLKLANYIQTQKLKEERKCH